MRKRKKLAGGPEEEEKRGKEEGREEEERRHGPGGLHRTGRGLSAKLIMFYLVDLCMLIIDR